MSERPWHERHLWQIQPVRDVALILAAVGLFQLGSVLSVVTVPILIALALAYIAEPLVQLLERRSPALSRTRIVISLLGALACVVALVLVLAVPLLVGQVGQLWKQRAEGIHALDRLGRDERVPGLVRPYLEETAQGLAGLLSISLAETRPGGSATTAAGASTVGHDGDGSPAPPELTPEHLQALVRAEVAAQLRQHDSAPVVKRDDTAQVGHALQALSQVVGGLVSLGVALFLVGFFFLVFSLSFPHVQRIGVGLVPANQRDRWLPILARMDTAIAGFVRGRITISLILTVLFVIGWSVVDVPFALLLGLLTGILTLIPYAANIGAVVAYAVVLVEVSSASPGSSLYLTTGAEGEAAVSWWRVAILPGLPYVLAQTLDDYLLTPVIQGKATNLSMPTIVVAVIAGGSLGGLFGMLIAIPVAACARILCEEVLWPRLKAWLEGEEDDPLPLG